jgi:hypothetical protein
MTHFSLFRQVCQIFLLYFYCLGLLRKPKLRFQQSLKLYTGKYASVNFSRFLLICCRLLFSPWQQDHIGFTLINPHQQSLLVYIEFFA